MRSRPDSQRVVVTGVGVTSPIGSSFDSVCQSLQGGHSGIRCMPDWDEFPELAPRVAGLVADIDLHEVIPRKIRRSMGRVAQLCCYAAGDAVKGANLSTPMLSSGRIGVAMGSTVGSPSATLEWYRNIIGKGVRANKGTAFLQVMSHTCAANVALAFGVTGRVWGASSACTSSSQAIGLGLDTLRAGAQDIMICGGAEEAHYTTAAVFDLVGAASSKFNAEPNRTPRPFDAQRDGMVVGEGAGALVLERLEHAKQRDASILAEVLGFGTTCDGEHITSPAEQGMTNSMHQALEDAGLRPADIQYVNAHATGTILGDSTEAKATARVFGDKVPVSSTKGYVGHTLGACGAIESVFLLGMIRHGFLAPTLNLEVVDSSCVGVWHLKEALKQPLRYAMNNNFAFGGINTSLVFAAYEG